MALPVPRLHLFEIDDQPWFPSFLRARVQATLTHFWNFNFPVFLPTKLSAVVSKKLQQVLGPRIAEFTYVDFCAGAGGPTPAIEKILNSSLGAENVSGSIPRNGGGSSGATSMAELEMSARLRSGTKTAATQLRAEVDFVLTDIAPHPTAWAQASEESSRLHYVKSPCDASAAPADLLSARTTLSPRAAPGTVSARLSSRPPFRLFFLAFHHFDDDLAKAILKDTLATSAGFGIFEIQDRTFAGLITVLGLGPLMWLTFWYYFWHDPVMLFWTYVVPVVPFVIVYDGIVSCLRTRTGDEVRELIRDCGVKPEERGWHFTDGVRGHPLMPGGNLRYFMGYVE